MNPNDLVTSLPAYGPSKRHARSHPGLALALGRSIHQPGRQSGLDCDALVAAVNELNERCWVNITWCVPRARMPEGLPERFREVERVTTTRFGRFRFPVAWSTR